MPTTAAIAMGVVVAAAKLLLKNYPWPAPPPQKEEEEKRKRKKETRAIKTTKTSDANDGNVAHRSKGEEDPFLGSHSVIVSLGTLLHCPLSAPPPTLQRPSGDVGIAQKGRTTPIRSRQLSTARHYFYLDAILASLVVLYRIG